MGYQVTSPYYSMPAQMQAVPPSMQVEKSYQVPINENRGWIRTGLHLILQANPGLEEGLRDMIGHSYKWKDTLTHSWWMSFNLCKPHESVKHMALLKDLNGKPQWDNIRELFTASNICFGQPIPEALFTMSKAVVEQVLLYEAVTSPVTVDLEELNVWPEFVPMREGRNLRQEVHAFLQCEPLMEILFSQGRPPNLVYLLHAHIPKHKTLIGLHGNQLRKILCSIFLMSGLPIPDDYLYIDLDVQDYVTKSSQYELVQRPFKAA